MTRRELFMLPLLAAVPVRAALKGEPERPPELRCLVLIGDFVHFADGDVPFTVLNVENGVAKLLEHTHEGWYKPARYAKVGELRHYTAARFRECGCICHWTP